MTEYWISYRIVEKANGTLDVYDSKGNLYYEGISRKGFVQVLESMIMAE